MSQTTVTDTETTTPTTSSSSGYCSIPELLWHREVAGIRSCHDERVSRHRRFFFGDLAPSVDDLSSTMAWNYSRMQNMILSVGPGTPASLLLQSSIDAGGAASNPMESSDDDDDDQDYDMEADDDDDDDDDVDVGFIEDEEEHDHPMTTSDCPHHTNENEGDSDDDDDTEHGVGHHPHTRSPPSNKHDQENVQQQQQHPPPPWVTMRNERYAPVPSMRHGGCINTASWITSPWRLSTVSHTGPFGMTSSSISSNHDVSSASVHPIPSRECPTQLITSGDDRVVKFWDVSLAMGTANPLPGGVTTICPFSAPIPRWSCDVARKRWKQYYLKRSNNNNNNNKNMLNISGSVIPLLTLSTGHRANVFHVTPLDFQIGKVATCGADGYLRLSDVVSETTSIVVSPEYDQQRSNTTTSAIGGSIGNLGFFSLQTTSSSSTGMCFSHHFLNANTGLLCSERGLRRFDIRLPPREQSTHNILTCGAPGESYRSCCKACAIYSSSSSSQDGQDEVESSYVFAGGTYANVALLDLRMTGGGDDSYSKVVEIYRPNALEELANVSVSGLDISKDKRELLVSYENDQIYTFPIFPKSSSAAGPTLEEIEAMSNEDKEDRIVSELCCYGAHLNRFTFLKNAKYAGPKDDYICTGSDSGRAWIYDRASGSVAAFLNADRSTCNGVVPHPTLPFFITYGIDSTAKLWRATLPVDSNVDDSAEGRAKCSHHQPYEMSPLVRNWQAVQDFLDPSDTLASSESITILPDQVPHSKEMVRRGRFGRAFLWSTGAPGTTRIGNDLHNLQQILRQNSFACLRALREEDDEPVRSGFVPYHRRASAIRLRHQADRLGLLWNRTIPWMFQTKRLGGQVVVATPSTSCPSTTVSAPMAYGDLVDRVPDHPSDWIPYDPHMTKEPQPCGTAFNIEDYDDLLERYRNPRGCTDDHSTKKASWKRTPSREDESNYIPCTPKQDEPIDDLANGSSKPEIVMLSLDEISEETEVQAKEALKILCETATLLKEGGNTALHAGNVHLAARRYDKALQYCAAAVMDFPSSNLSFKDDPQLSGFKWTQMLKVVITTRLNLSMCLLRPEIAQPQRAVDQAQLALKALKPFGTRKGVVIYGDEDEITTDEPASTYNEARELLAKAYFRLGSAQYEFGDYAASCRSFEHGAKITKATSKSAQPDKLIMRRLAEAKRENARQSKRQKKMFKFMFSGEDPDEPNSKTTASASTEAADEDDKDKPTATEDNSEKNAAADVHDRASQSGDVEMVETETAAGDDSNNKASGETSKSTEDEKKTSGSQE